MQNRRPKHQLVDESTASFGTDPSPPCFRKASLLNSASRDYNIYDWLTCLKGWDLKKLSLILLDSVAGSAASISNDLLKHIQCSMYLLVRTQEVLLFHSMFHRPACLSPSINFRFFVRFNQHCLCTSPMLYAPYIQHTSTNNWNGDLNYDLIVLFSLTQIIVHMTRKPALGEHRPTPSKSFFRSLNLGYSVGNNIRLF